MTIAKAKAILEHLEETNQAWCFDEFGRIWTRETLNLYVSGIKVSKGV